MEVAALEKLVKQLLVEQLGAKIDPIKRAVPAVVGARSGVFETVDDAIAWAKKSAKRIC
jgi:hypothetical protein